MKNLEMEYLQYVRYGGKGIELDVLENGKKSSSDCNLQP